VAASAGISQTHQGAADACVVTGVTLDSRSILPGDLYAALPGANVHGAQFVDAAIGLGAVAVLTDPAGAALLAQSEAHVPVLVVPEPRAVLGKVSALIYGRASQSLTMLGITGTNGKTTTAYLLDSALRALGRRTGLIGTVETRIGEDRVKSSRTTPESADLHALFALMLEGGVETCTMEVSSHALTLHRVDGVRFDVVAFTNLSQDHLDFHGSMEEYFLAKAALFVPERALRAVVCVDDSWGQRLALHCQVPVTTVSSRPEISADWQLEHTSSQGSGFELVGGDRRLALRSALPGDFNRVNTAVAALVLLAAGHPMDTIAAALSADPYVPGRMERVLVEDAGESGRRRMPMAVVDFAHTPEAVAAALKALRHETKGSLIAVLGAGGERDRGKRAAMGAAAAAHADVVIVTDDNPRSEDPATIRAALIGGAVGQERPSRSTSGPIRDIGDRALAIREAVAYAGAGDTVVVLGKGHETGQETAGVTHPFDDRSQLRSALMQAIASGEKRPMDPTASEETAADETASDDTASDRTASGEAR